MIYIIFAPLDYEILQDKMTKSVTSFTIIYFNAVSTATVQVYNIEAELDNIIFGWGLDYPTVFCEPVKQEIIGIYILIVILQAIWH